MRRIISFVLAVMTVQWAIFWLAPSARFNLVDAADKTNTSTNNIKGQLVSHSYTVQAQLKAANEYLDGVDRILKADVIHSDQVVKHHLGILSSDTMNALKVAKTHASELSGVASMRGPASNSGDDLLARVHADIDRAIALNSALSQHLKDNTFLESHKKGLREEVASLRDTVHKANSDLKNLDGRLGV